MPSGSSRSPVGGMLESATCSCLTWSVTLPGDLERRLVEAGNGAARPQRLELAVDVPPAAVLLLEQPRGVDALELAVVGDAQAGGAGRHRRRELEPHEVIPARDDDRRAALGAALQDRLADGDLGGVEPQHAAGPAHLEIDRDHAGEGVVLGDDREVHRGADRTRAVVQPQRRRRLGRRQGKRRRYGPHDGQRPQRRLAHARSPPSMAIKPCARGPAAARRAAAADPRGAARRAGRPGWRAGCGRFGSPSSLSTCRHMPQGRAGGAASATTATARGRRPPAASAAPSATRSAQTVAP